MLFNKTKKVVHYYNCPIKMSYRKGKVTKLTNFHSLFLKLKTLGIKKSINYHLT